MSNNKQLDYRTLPQKVSDIKNLFSVRNGNCIQIGRISRNATTKAHKNILKELSNFVFTNFYKQIFLG